jgi:hypothetical protein
MESNGLRDKIQISQSTADLLVNAGKSHWMQPREDLVNAKGKGLMQTYWLNLGSKRSSSISGSLSATEDSGAMSENHDACKPDEMVRQERLVDWMVELLAERVKKLVSLSISPNLTYYILLKVANRFISLLKLSL